MFTDRVAAGVRLAELLRDEQGPDTVVLGLARGGVVCAYEVARALAAPLDVVIVRKIGMPSQPEYAMGAVDEDGDVAVNPDIAISPRQLPQELAADFARISADERAEIERRVAAWRHGRPRAALTGRNVVVVDDGLATGATAEAVLMSVRRRGPRRIVLAVPVGAAASIARLRPLVDRVVCAETPTHFGAVGAWYDDFRPVADPTVTTLLARAAEPQRRSLTVHVADAGSGEAVTADLAIPPGAAGVVIFAHGSGSSRHSPRNRAVADALCAAGFASVLADLLTAAEDADRHWVFDIGLLARRLGRITDAVAAEPHLARLPLGYFGASTGAAAAIIAAAERHDIAAVVSRGGRPDLAGPALGRLTAPTLLIVGGDDRQVAALNHAAADAMHCAHEVTIVPGATHLFAEPGTLELVAQLAADHFRRYLAPAPDSGDGPWRASA